jgi:hypothetical protein
MLTVDPMAYARSRQAEWTRQANAARLVRVARSTPRHAAARSWPGPRRLTARLQLEPASPAACCC